MKDFFKAAMKMLVQYKVYAVCAAAVIVLGVTAAVAVPRVLDNVPADATTAESQETQGEQSLEGSVAYEETAGRVLAEFALEDETGTVANAVHNVGVISATTQTETQTEEATEQVEVEHKKLDKEKIPEVEKAPEGDAGDPEDGAADAGVGTEVDISDLNENKGLYEASGLSLGIDVSHHQGKIDWQQVKDSGVEFAIIRVGYRSRDTGTIYEDRQAAYNMKNAINAGIKVGVYFFSQAISEYEAVEEASWVLDYIQKYQITYPVVYDCEYIGQYRTGAAGVTKTQRTDYAIAFMETVRNSGYTPMMYASKNGYSKNWETSRMANRYKIWVAQYPAKTVDPLVDKTTYTGKYDMWQYSSKGSVPGISGNVDMDVSYFSYVGTPESSVQNVKFVVKDTSGNPVSGVTVQLIGNETEGSVTDASGTALFTHVGFGDYEVKVAGVPAGYRMPANSIHVSFSKAMDEYLDETSLVLEPGTDDSTEFIVGNETFQVVNEQVRVTASSLNLRYENRVAGDTSYKTVPRNTVLKRTGVGNNGWSRVEYDGKTLYASSQYLTTDLCGSNHSWGDWTVVKEATATEKGSMERECSVCHQKETKEIPVTACEHKWSDKVTVVTAATCKAEGKGTRECTICGAKEDVVIPKLNEHTWDKGKESDGVITYTCQVCGAVKKEKPSIEEPTTGTKPSESESSTAEEESSSETTPEEPSSSEPTTEKPSSEDPTEAASESESEPPVESNEESSNAPVEGEDGLGSPSDSDAATQSSENVSSAPDTSSTPASQE